MEVLLGLKEPIQKLLTAGGDGKLRVELGQLRSLAFRGVLDPDKTHVVLLEPTEGAMLQQINELVFRTFKDAAMLVDSAATPNHMSCTVINTGHRAGYELGKPRIPFRLEALYASQALKRLRLASADTVPDLKQPLKLDIGTAIIPGLRLRRRLGEVRPESKDVIYDGQLDF
ncbi:hypothetical protein K439DRAFT_1631931 [Ramaria rubella]|nr:hypothetical protein K439DRAFT_1631931 [Ramaria rubella]